MKPFSQIQSQTWAIHIRAHDGAQRIGDGLESRRNSNPIALNGTVDQNVVIEIVVLAALASVLCGALPASRSSHVPAAEALKDEAAIISDGSHNRQLLGGLVVAQIALSLALLLISGLFLQTLRNVSAGDLGFKQDHVLTASVGLPVFDVRAMRETTQMATIFAAMQSTFAGILAAIALILATTGIYGVLAYRTALRTLEIGIGAALGASPGDVLRLVFLQGLSLTAIGLSLGLALSFSLTHFISALLYGVGANDPLTVIVVVVLLAAMSLLS